MNSEARQAFLRESARRALARAALRRRKELLQRQDLLELKIQTMEPWKRLFVGFCGLAAAVGAGLMFSENSRTVGLILLVVALLLLVFAWWGLRRSIERVFDQFDLLQVLGEFF